MSKRVEYFMTPVSPWTYLGHERLRTICRAAGASIDLHLMDLGKVFPVSGGVALKDRAPQRQAYRLVELERWRDYLGLPLTLQPKHFPVPNGPASLLILAVQAAQGTEVALDVAGDCLRAVWAEERNISDEATLAQIVAARGLDAAALLAASKTPETQARYDAGTQRAIERGVFGAPAYVIDGQLFWGQDRLEFLERALQGAPR